MACLTADKSIAGVVDVVAVAKGGPGRAAARVDTDGCGAAVPDPAERGGVAPDAEGTSESGAVLAPAFGAASFGVAAVAGLPDLIAGRDRGNGVGPGGGAACTPPVRIHKQARTPIIRKPGTFPPDGRVADLRRISSAGSVNKP
jgi:hypothetical protein